MAQGNEGETKGEMTNNELYEKLMCRMDEKHRSLKSEMIAEINQSIGTKFLAVSEEVSRLNASLVVMNQRLNHLENIIRSKNIIIFGLEEQQGEITEQLVIDFIGHKIGYNIQDRDLDQVYRIGKPSLRGSRPILVKFICMKSKQIIQKMAHKLKGTNYAIDADLTPSERETRKELLHHKRVAQSAGNQVTQRKNGLMINGKWWTLDDLRNIDVIENIEGNVATMVADKTAATKVVSNEYHTPSQGSHLSIHSFQQLASGLPRQNSSGTGPLQNSLPAATQVGGGMEKPTSFKRGRTAEEDSPNENIENDVSSSRRYPVMVFIHGESFEWNSGNPYDGSVLAAYGHVIVVTINFRLGILGFLKAGTELDSRSNFGLVDQIAALLWVKDNIAAFGGDINSVTLFGHGTGAVCASLLMISPMILKGNERLFHRAILMGGTALADWALAGNPTGVTYQVSKALNCQIHDDFAECLRRKRLDEIMAAGAVTPDYKTRFGPVVDSIVVPNEPKKSMTQYNDLFRRFELMYGVTEQESLHLLGPVALAQGMLEKERDQELLAYFHSRCEMKPGLCLQRTLGEYSRNDDFPQNDQLYGDYTGYEPDRASLARDALLDILSDARSVAPIVQMARYHAALNLQSYFYVFTHKTHSKEYIRDKSYNGEELPYVFGVPLDGPKFHFVDTYSEREKLFSEIVMMYFSNFAETGNPNMPRREMFYNMNSANWAQYDVEWPEFDLQEERYIELKIPPQPSQHYRSSKINYWNKQFPNLTENIPYNSYPASHPTKRTPLIFLPPNPPRRTPPSFLYDHLPKKSTTTPRNEFENFFKPFKPTENEVYGTIISSGKRPDNMIENNVYGTVLEAPTAEVKQSSTMSIVTIVGGLFLVVNLILLIILYFKCYRNKKNSRGKTTNITVASEDEKRQKDEETFLINGCNIVRLMGKSSKSDDTYDAVKPETTPKNKLSRQMSSSTIDAHTKVREWIAQEIIHKYSPRFFRRPGQDNNAKDKVLFPEELSLPTGADKDSTLGRSPTRPVSPVEQKPIAMKTSTVTRHKVKVPKVSVAVDATPSGRGPSVLMQQPIELTKSLDYPNIKPNVEIPLRRSFTLEDFSPRIVEKRKDLRKSSNSIHMNLSDLQPTIIKISHCHSKSDPVQDLDYSAMKRLKTFDPNQNVNVTCRDENDCPIPLTPEESLRTIKRRNFPKVLPDLPGREAMTNKRLSMPTHGLYMPIGECSSFSPTNFPQGKCFGKFPPAPPPRASTLVKQSSSPLPVFISEPTLAEEPEEEPEVVCNNLYVGPLIPRRQLGQPVYGSLGNIKSGNEIKISVGSNTDIQRVDTKVGCKPSLATKPIDNRSHRIIPRNQHHNNQNDESSISSYSTNGKEKTSENEEIVVGNDRINCSGNHCTSGGRIMKKSQIPTLSKSSNPSLNKESSSSDSTPSEESDTGTVVKKI